ncbi:MAG: methionyl-tRNA formyltransferase [Anaerolineales bacterium]|nr:methionyl-tRNA formyltransferase [Anaerolineales bacterium]
MKAAKLVFMGSPDFALPSLQALAQHFNVCGVVTQPDRPAGRGRQLNPPPVKVLAKALGLPVIQPVRIHKDPQAMAQLQAWQPDAIIVAAFGQILRPQVLDLPPYGCINVHASLLPRWRGAAPINAAILHGDHETGITIMKMDAGLDTGPILSQRTIPIQPQDTAGTLFDRLAAAGAELLVETLPGYLSGEIQPHPQQDELATYAPMLTKAEGELDFQHTAAELERQVRAFNPWPGTFIHWQDTLLKIHRAHRVRTSSPGAGVLTIQDGLPAVGCSQDLLVLDEVQPAGKRSMPGSVFLHGARDWGTQI